MSEEDRDYESEIAALQKKLGDQGNEIGQLRKVADQVLQTQVEQQEAEWDYDPQEKEIRSLKSEVNQIKEAEAVRRLEADFPGFRELPNNQEFQDWVQESPVRSDLYRRADGMDLAAAREMLALWNEREKMRQELQIEGNSHRRQALKDATMEKGSAGGGRKQYYSRTELIDMRLNNPAKYESMRDDIMQAYREGRVRR